MKLIGSNFRMDKRKYCFSQKVVKMWDSLPEDITMAIEINSFKKV